MRPRTAGSLEDSFALSQARLAAIARAPRGVAEGVGRGSGEGQRTRHLIVAGRAGGCRGVHGRAIRLSPRDPDLYLWYYVVCHAHTHLARDAATIEWCLKSIGTGKMFWHVWVDLASAYAWRGQTAEAAAAVAEILKLRPGLTVQQMVEEAWAHSDNATFRKEYQRIAEGVRKAGLPEKSSVPRRSGDERSARRYVPPEQARASRVGPRYAAERW